MRETGDGSRDVVVGARGGGGGGVLGNGEAAWRLQGLEARPTEKSSLFLRYARQAPESSETS